MVILTSNLLVLLDITHLKVPNFLEKKKKQQQQQQPIRTLKKPQETNNSTCNTKNVHLHSSFLVLTQ